MTYPDYLFENVIFLLLCVLLSCSELNKEERKSMLLFD